MDAKTQISALLKQLSVGVYEKQHILAMTLLSAVAGESIFLLGPPGTAKSLVARRLKLAFKDGQSFEYLMSRFSTPDEIFGPISISLLKNEDRYERVVQGFLPTAHIVFLDEIWKASPSIQNALLTAINERIFQNGDKTLRLPMKALIAASNELPAEEEGLEALWDRFLVRMVSNCIQSETEFFKMIRNQTIQDVSVPDGLLITETQYDSWQKEINSVQIPDEICASVSYIRKQLKEQSKKEDVNVMDYYISDRRWKKCFHLLQTSAFLNGRKAIDMTDIPLLVHCLWNKSETIPIIIDMVCCSLTVNIDKQIDKLSKDIDKALKEKSKRETGTIGRFQINGQNRIIEKRNGKYGIIDEYGNTIVPFEYDDVGSDPQGFRMKKNGNWYIIDNKGRINPEGTKIQNNVSAPNRYSTRISDENFTITNYFYYTVQNYPQGRCLFYKADYEYVEDYTTGKTTDGIVYPDNDKKAWIVRAIYTGAPFAYKTKTDANVKKVKLKKCTGGIFIDGIPYGFEKVKGANATLFSSVENEASVALQTLENKVQPEFEKLKDLFYNSANLFITEDDLKLSKKQLSLCEKRLEEMKIKAQNAQQLL